MCVILDDNIIGASIRRAAENFLEQAAGARILLKEVPDAERFGVAEISGDRTAGIEERPARPKSIYAVTYPSPMTIRPFRKSVPSFRRRAANAVDWGATACTHWSQLESHPS